MLNMKKVQNFYLYSYRLVGFVFLVGLVSSILWYGLSIFFFVTNASWSIPLILSPNQEKVLAHREHIVNLEHELAKNIAELAADKEAIDQKKTLLHNIKELYTRFEQSMVSQSIHHAKIGKMFDDLAQEKAKSVDELKKLIADLKLNEREIDKELNVGLITKQEAVSQRLALNNLRSNLIDAKVNLHDLNQRALDFNTASNTLNGASTNLNAMQVVVKNVELDRQITQLTSEIFALNVKIEHLDENIDKRKKELILMKRSPYILATQTNTSVAFVPYKNLSKVHIGTPIYSCYLEYFLCYQSGQVTRIFKAEEYAKHPIFKSDLKGQFIGVSFNHKADAQKKLLFLHSKPMLF